MLIETRRDSEGGVDVKPEEGALQEREVRMVAAFPERNTEGVGQAQRAKTKDMGSLGASTRDIISTEDVAKERGDGVGVDGRARVGRRYVASRPSIACCARANPGGGGYPKLRSPRRAVP